MELVTASDLFLTASLTLLLSILVAKLLSMAMTTTDTNSETFNPILSTNHPVYEEEEVCNSVSAERLTVPSAQSERRVEFLSPIQVTTNVETEQGEVEEESKVVSDDVFEVSEVGVVSAEEQVEEKIIETIEEREELSDQVAVEGSEEQKNIECFIEEEIKEEEQVNSEMGNSVEEIRVKEKDDDDVNVNVNVKDDDDGNVNVEDDDGKINVNVKNGDDDGDVNVKDDDDVDVNVNVNDGNVNVKNDDDGNVNVNVKDDDDDGDVNVKDDDDDWEGIERSELEKVFIEATEFVFGEGGEGLLASIGSNVQMELYGLHKVAMEGPCHEPQPMPLKLSARAKWNAWQKLGNMSPDVAMEQYVNLLSDTFPGWMKLKHTSASAGMSEHEVTGSEANASVTHDMSTSLSHQQMIITERELEQESGGKASITLPESDLENNVKK